MAKIEQRLLELGIVLPHHLNRGLLMFPAFKPVI